jgi:hypothetical protein
MKYNTYFSKIENGKVITCPVLATESYQNETYIIDGIIRWKSNNAIPPKGILDTWKELNLPFDYAGSLKQLDIDTAKNIVNYVKSKKSHKYSAEEMYEMRSAFGEGVMVTNVITGKSIKL